MGAYIWEVSGRHLGGIPGASGNRLGGILEAQVAKGGSRAYCGKEWCHYAAECQKFPHLFEGDISYHRISTATFAKNKEHIKTHGKRHENPYREICVWGTRSLSICITPARDPEQHFVSLHTTGR